MPVPVPVPVLVPRMCSLRVQVEMKPKLDAGKLLMRLNRQQNVK